MLNYPFLDNDEPSAYGKWTSFPYECGDRSGALSLRREHHLVRLQDELEEEGILPRQATTFGMSRQCFHKFIQSLPENIWLAMRPDLGSAHCIFSVVCYLRSIRLYFSSLGEALEKDSAGRDELLRGLESLVEMVKADLRLFFRILHDLGVLMPAQRDTLEIVLDFVEKRGKMTLLKSLVLSTLSVSLFSKYKLQEGRFVKNPLFYISTTLRMHILLFNWQKIIGQ